MDEVADQPVWLRELEKSKRRARLAHEAGAGAPCMICNSACPGLDLHFWRKICRNCKCSRDDHDVDDDDFPQFDLLFGPAAKFKKKSMTLRVSNKKQHDAESAFEWVPPDIPNELAADYMKALPSDKLPIRGSVGAALRRQLLQKQIPLHDIDHKACNILTQEEKTEFDRYLENLKRYVGQGRVSKILGARPFERSLMTPANATDMQRFSPQHKVHTPSTSVHLRTPSSFTTKVNTKNPYLKLAYDKENNTFNPEKHSTVSSTVTNAEVVKSIPVQTGIYNASVCTDNNLTSLENSQTIINNAEPTHASINQSPMGNEYMFSLSQNNKQGDTLPQKYSCYDKVFTSDQMSSVPSQKEMLKNPALYLTHSENIDNKDAFIAETILADALLPPSAIHSSDIIGSTLDEKGLSYIREKLTNKYGAQEDSVMRNVHEISKDLDKIAFNRTNNSNNNDKEVKKPGTIAATKHHFGSSSTLEDKEREDLSRHDTVPEVKPVEAEKHMYKIDSATVQSASLDSIQPSNIGKKGKFVQSMHNPSSASQLPVLQPVNNIFEDNDKYSKTSILPGMSERNLQISNNYVDKALLQPNSTDMSLPVGLSTVNTSCLKGELNSLRPVQSNVIHSESLQNQIFPHDAVGTSQLVQNLSNIDHLKQDMEGLTMHSAKIQKCCKCQEEIRIGEVVVTVEKAKNESWHPGCFVCSVCNELLVDLVYFYYKNKLCCGRDLAKLLGIPRCFACDELIFVREYTVAEGHNYHVKHFCCWDCDIPLAGQKYISENDRPLCLLCYQRVYAKTCNTCNTVIAADQQGVAAKNLNFHATETCFCCYICKKSLLNGRMAIKEDKPFCSKECISKFQNQK